jgi:hypothetical protein
MQSRPGNLLARGCPQTPEARQARAPKYILFVGIHMLCLSVTREREMRLLWPVRPKGGEGHGGGATTKGIDELLGVRVTCRGARSKGDRREERRLFRSWVRP